MNDRQSLVLRSHNVANETKTFIVTTPFVRTDSTVALNALQNMFASIYEQVLSDPGVIE